MEKQGIGMTMSEIRHMSTSLFLLDVGFPNFGPITVVM